MSRRYVVAVPRFLTRQPNFVGSAGRPTHARLVGCSPPMAPLPCSARPRALIHPRRVELRLSRLITTISCAVPIPLLCYVVSRSVVLCPACSCLRSCTWIRNWLYSRSLSAFLCNPPNTRFSIGLIDACAAAPARGGRDGTVDDKYQLAIRYWWFIFDLFIYFISRANPLSTP